MGLILLRLRYASSVCSFLFVSVQLLSHGQLFLAPWTAARQAPLPMEFPRQEYWSRLPFPPPEDLPDPGIEPTSPALAGRFFTTEPAGKPSLKPAEKPLLVTKTSPTKVLDHVSLSPTSVPLPLQSGLAWPGLQIILPATATQRR